MGHLEHRTAENSLQRKGAHELDVFDPGTDIHLKKKKKRVMFLENCLHFRCPQVYLESDNPFYYKLANLTRTFNICLDHHGNFYFTF